MRRIKKTTSPEAVQYQMCRNQCEDWQRHLYMRTPPGTEVYVYPYPDDGDDISGAVRIRFRRGGVRCEVTLHLDEAEKLLPQLIAIAQAPELQSGYVWTPDAEAAYEAYAQRRQ